GRGSGADGVGGGDGEGVGGAVGQAADGGAGCRWASGDRGRCLGGGPDERGDRVTGDRPPTVRRRGPAHLRRRVPGGRGDGGRSRGRGRARRGGGGPRGGGGARAGGGG